MEPEAYFKSMKGLKGWELKDECGLYGNWPIITAAEYFGLHKIFYSDQNWIEKWDSGSEGYAIHRTLPLFVELKSWPGSILNGFEDVKKITEPIFFNSMKTHLLFHPNSNHLPGNKIDQLSSLADTVEKISRELIRLNVSFCLPQSIGWKYAGDLSRIVIYDAEKIKK